MSRNRPIADIIRVDDDQDNVPIVRLRTARQRRRRDEEVPLSVEEKP